MHVFWSTVGSVCNTAGVQSLLSELWPCVGASVGRVAVTRLTVFVRLMTV